MRLADNGQYNIINMFTIKNWVFVPEKNSNTITLARQKIKFDICVNTQDEDTEIFSTLANEILVTPSFIRRPDNWTSIIRIPRIFGVHPHFLECLFGAEWNGKVTLAVTLTQRSLFESNGTTKVVH